MDSPTSDTNLEDPAEPQSLGPESRLRAKIMFFVAAVFLFGVAIILPPGNPQLKPKTTEKALLPVSKMIDELEQAVIAKDPDHISIQNRVFDLKSMVESLPSDLDRIVKIEAEKLIQPEEESDTVTVDGEELPTESAAVRAVAFLFPGPLENRLPWKWAHPWFFWTMVGLWSCIILDGLVGVFQASDSKFKSLRRLWLVALIPPMRMAFSPARPNLEVWFPRAGWLPVNKESGEVMELVMAMPMLLLTLSIVPIEIVERFFPHLVLKYPAVAIALHLLGALIWIAFVVEFVMLFGVAQNKIDYCKRHWVNLIIIILPLIAFLRVLRITRIVRIIRAGKLMRVYRIRGVYVRALRVAVLFSLVDRLLNRKPEKYLTKLEEQIADKQKELAELEENAEELRGEIKQLAEVNPQ